MLLVRVRHFTMHVLGTLIVILAVTNAGYICPKTMTCSTINECVTRHTNHGGLPNSVYFKCSVSGSKICCPEVNTALTGQAEDFDLNANDIDQSLSPENHRNRFLLPTNCGYVLAKRIMAGENATLGEYPWMALIGFTNKFGKKKNICGGTLINDRYVLTAAHCLFRDDSKLSHVTLGEFDLSKERDCDVFECYEPALEVPVAKLIPHENYDETSWRNDIALIRLSYNVSMKGRPNIFPICLPFNLTLLNITPNFSYEATGWGFLNSYEDTSPILQRVGLEGTKCDICPRGASSATYCPISDKQFCAQGFRKKDVCKGDSGGPLTNEPGSFVYQLGITSFKSTSICGTDAVPSVFTNVSSYLNWILDNIER